jgi:hypothetical protein
MSASDMHFRSDRTPKRTQTHYNNTGSTHTPMMMMMMIPNRIREQLTFTADASSLLSPHCILPFITLHTPIMFLPNRKKPKFKEKTMPFKFLKFK